MTLASFTLRPTFNHISLSALQPSIALSNSMSCLIGLPALSLTQSLTHSPWTPFVSAVFIAFWSSALRDALPDWPVRGPWGRNNLEAPCLNPVCALYVPTSAVQTEIFIWLVKICCCFFIVSLPQHSCYLITVFTDKLAIKLWNVGPLKIWSLAAWM